VIALEHRANPGRGSPEDLNNNGRKGDSARSCSALKADRDTKVFARRDGGRKPWSERRESDVRDSAPRTLARKDHSARWHRSSEGVQLHVARRSQRAQAFSCWPTPRAWQSRSFQNVSRAGSAVSGTAVRVHGRPTTACYLLIAGRGSCFHRRSGKTRLPEAGMSCAANRLQLPADNALHARASSPTEAEIFGPRARAASPGCLVFRVRVQDAMIEPQRLLQAYRRKGPIRSIGGKA